MCLDWQLEVSARYRDVAHRDLVKGGELKLLRGVGLGGIGGSVVVVRHRDGYDDWHAVQHGPEEDLEACTGGGNRWQALRGQAMSL